MTLQWKGEKKVKLMGVWGWYGKEKEEVGERKKDKGKMINHKDVWWGFLECTKMGEWLKKKAQQVREVGGERTIGVVGEGGVVWWESDDMNKKKDNKKEILLYSWFYLLFRDIQT